MLRASAYEGRSENPVKLACGSSPRNLQRRGGAATRRVVRDLVALGLMVTPDPDAGAHDLRVERAREPAVARDEQQADAVRLSCSSRIGTRGTSPAAWAASRVIRLIASAYGRRASIRCSARRRRAAATISIARVIFWMFLTASMRLRTSRWVGIASGATALRGHGLLLLALLGAGARPAVAVRAARRSGTCAMSSASSGWPSSSRS